MNVRAALRRACACVLLVAVLSGCAQTSSYVPTTAPPSSHAASSPPTSETAPETAPATDGRITAGVTQGRSDYAAAVFAITVENLTEVDLTVTSAVLSSAAFRQDAAWTGDAVVPPGSTRALRLPVPTFACPVTDRGVSVVVSTTQGDSDRASMLVPVDPFSVVERLSGDACLADAVAETVALGFETALPITGSGHTAVATLSLTLDPTDDLGAEDLTIVGVDATTLLSPADGSPRWELREEVEPVGEPRTVDLSVIPARCDTHAIAEDKVGTVLRVRVMLADGQEGAVSVPAPPELRAALFSFVQTACAG